jgi:NAD-dependent SIR2 family protein deacetylase
VKRRIRIPDPRTDLIHASSRGGITLVLGAGISVARGLPNWNSLAQDLWRQAFGRRKSPWETAGEAKSPREVPQFLPIVFELAYEKLGPERFLSALRTKLYQKARFPIKDRKFSTSHESLAVLARLIVQEFRRGRERRIDSIITLNADDLFEQAAFALVGGASWKLGEEVVRVVARPTHSALRGDRFRPIPVYHIHGFLPSNIASNYGARSGRSGMTFADAFDHMLVFTDAQYWSTSATALAFANRVMLSALSETRCLFIGLSMTDINLLRWLALRTLERDRDVSEVQRLGRTGRRTGIQVEIVKRMFNRHFWIRPASDDPTGFLSEFLAVRGIHSVELSNWTGVEFQRLIQKCFPKRANTIRSKMN